MTPRLATGLWHLRKPSKPPDLRAKIDAQRGIRADWLTIPLPLFAIMHAFGPLADLNRGNQRVKLRRNFGSLLGALALAVPFAALASPLIALDSAVYVEKLMPGNGRLLQPAARLVRGDRVVYVVNWYRMGGQGAFTVSNPLPRSVYYQGSADGAEEVSVDGGKSWGKLDQLRNGARLATPEDVTNIRWHVPAQAAAAGSGEITYSAIVR